MSMSPGLLRGLALSPLFLLPATGAWADQESVMEWSWVNIALFVVGLGLTAYWAVDAFAKPTILAETPTPPRYLTRRQQYFFGTAIYVLCCLTLFAIVAVGHRELLPAIEFFNPQLYDRFEKWVEGPGVSYVVVVVLACIVFLGLVKIDDKRNPLYVARLMIFSSIAIPRFASQIIARAETALDVPQLERDRVASDPATPFVAVGDFKKDRQSIDRIWAELSYLHRWLRGQQSQGEDATFFGEPSFAWDDLCASYPGTARLVGDLKKGRTPIGLDRTQVHDTVRKLRRKITRLVACYLLFRHGTEAEIYEAAQRLGIPMGTARVENPARYLVVYWVGVCLAVWIGVPVSAASFDYFWAGADLLGALSQDFDRVLNWIIYAIANIAAPLSIVLLVRYVRWRIDPRRPQVYLASYAWVFALAAVAAVFLLAGALKVVSDRYGDSDYFAVVWSSSAKWFLTPALLSVYVVYHLDRQIDPRLPPMPTGVKATLMQLASAFLFAAGLVLLLLPPAMTLKSAAPPPTGWPDAKLQVVALGTTFLAAFVMACLAQFAFRKQAAASPGETPLPRPAISPADAQLQPSGSD